MILVENWISESREVRTAHLKLDEECIERGGNSTVHRGVLAQYLNTNLPSKVDLCHACHNDKCSNPKHLYWGTRKENVQDARGNGTFNTIWENLVNKYGYEEACIMNGRGDKSVGGKAGKGKIKSEEHKKKISLGLKKFYTESNASVMKSVTIVDLKSTGESLGGSSPPRGTKL